MFSIWPHDSTRREAAEIRSDVPSPLSPGAEWTVGTVSWGVPAQPGPGRTTILMRILILSPVLPYPPTWGFVTRVYHFVRLLARRHAVTLLSYADAEDRENVASLRAVCTDVHTIPHPTTTRTKRFRQLSSLFSPVSYQWRSHRSAPMQAKLTELTAQQRFDVIQIESSQLACFEFDRRPALVLDEHNIEYELLYRTFRTERSPLRRAYNWIEFKKFKREEISTWHRVTGTVTTSAREAEIVRELAPGKPATCVPNAVDVQYFSPASEPTDRDAIVLTGLMKYRPNVDAALYFVRDVLPQILVARPNLVFYIVGGDPPDEVRQLAGPNVVVTGTVADVRPYVRRAAVFVVPLRMGGGTRLKVLEGLAMQKAMVSTSLGCEGIEVEDQTHLLIADDPATFAGAVLRLLEDATLGETLARAGRDLVDRRYRWERVVGDLEAFYDELVGRHPGNP
jgi:sugar transferase (PEP-CTERM/EpsH1 system associated)